LLPNYGDIQDNKLYAMAHDYTESTDWSISSNTFVSNDQIPETNHVSPTEGEWVGSFRPTFVAEAVTDPNANDIEYYKFFVATGSNAESGTTAINSGWIETSSWTPSVDLANGTYYWKIHTRDNHGWESNCYSANDGCESWVVRVDGAQPLFSYLYAEPHSNEGEWYADNSPLMKWNASSLSGIDGYGYALCYEKPEMCDCNGDNGYDELCDPSNAACQHEPTICDCNGDGTFAEACDTEAPETVMWAASKNTQQFVSLDDGVYHFNIKAQNIAGTWSSNQRFSINVDITPPEAPAVWSNTHVDQNKWYTDTNLNLFWDGVYDSISGVINYSYRMDPVDDDAGTSAMGTTAFKNYPGLVSGEHHFFVRAQNGAGTWGNQSEYVVRIDTTPPTQPVITSASHDPETQWFDNRTPHVEWTAEDTLSGIQNYCYGIDQLDPAAPGYVCNCDTEMGIGESFTSPSLPDGEYWFHVRAQNSTGAWGSCTHRKIRIDGTAPTAATITSSSHPVETEWYHEGVASMAWTSTDISEITHQTYGFSKNASFNPSISSESVYPALGGNTSVNLDTHPDGPSAGTWYFKLKVKNGSGLWSSTFQRVLKVDTTPPTSINVISSTHPEMVPVHNDEPNFSYTATEDLSTIRDFCVNLHKVPVGDPSDKGTCDPSIHTIDATGSISYDLSTIYPADEIDGKYCLNVRARNSAKSSDGSIPGLWSTELKQYCIVVEMNGATSPAVVALNHPSPNSWYSDNQSVKFTFSAFAASGVKAYRYITALDDNTGVYDPDLPGFNGALWTTVEGTCDDPDTPEDEYVAPNIGGAGTPVDYGIQVNPDEYYFHVMALSCAQDAEWSDTGDRRVRIDQTPPAIEVGQLGSPTHDESVWCDYKDDPISPSCKNPILWFISNDTGSGSWGEDRILEYSWELDKTIDTIPDEIGDSPDGQYDGTSTFYKKVEYNNLTNGLWYFHVRARSNAVDKNEQPYNDWGDTRTFTLKIDVAPEGSVRVEYGVGVFGSSASQSGHYDDELQHYASLDAFYLNVHEVTNGEFTTCQANFNETTTVCKPGFSKADCESAYENPAYEWDSDRMECYLPSNGLSCSEGQYCHYKTDQPSPAGVCATGCDSGPPGLDNPTQTRSSTRASYFGNPSYANYPVLYVTWYAAQQYCLYKSMRLPTEHEWEAASHGYGVMPAGNSNRWPWGDMSPDDSYWSSPGIGKPSNYAGTALGDTTPANIGNGDEPACFFDGDTHAYDGGSLDTGDGRMKGWSVSEFEWLCDMSGNVGEWVQDWYGVYPEINTYDPMPAEGFNPVMKSEADCLATCSGAPACELACSNKVVRGGSFSSSARDSRVYYRGQKLPHFGYDDVGFRCADTSPNQN